MIRKQLGALQTAITCYQKGPRKVYLVAMVHMGTREYYNEVQAFLDTGNFHVLFEHVGDPADPSQRLIYTDMRDFKKQMDQLKN